MTLFQPVNTSFDFSRSSKYCTATNAFVEQILFQSCWLQRIRLGRLSMVDGESMYVRIIGCTSSSSILVVPEAIL